MDDSVTGENDLGGALELVKQLMEFFSGIGMVLKKFNSNCKAILDTLDSSLVSTIIHRKILCSV
jgi:hypothetical protein